MRDITREFKDIVEAEYKRKKITKLELSKIGKMSYGTFKAIFSGKIQNVRLSQAQAILDALGFELLIFEKDEQFNDKYDDKP